MQLFRRASVERSYCGSECLQLLIENTCCGGTRPWSCRLISSGPVQQPLLPFLLGQQEHLVADLMKMTLPLKDLPAEKRCLAPELLCLLMGQSKSAKLVIGFFWTGLHQQKGFELVQSPGCCQVLLAYLHVTVGMGVTVSASDSLC